MLAGHLSGQQGPAEVSHAEPKVPSGPQTTMALPSNGPPGRNLLTLGQVRSAVTFPQLKPSPPSSNALSGLCIALPRFRCGSWPHSGGWQIRHHLLDCLAGTHALQKALSAPLHTSLSHARHLACG